MKKITMLFSLFLGIQCSDDNLNLRNNKQSVRSSDEEKFSVLGRRPRNPGGSGPTGAMGAPAHTGGASGGIPGVTGGTPPSGGGIPGVAGGDISTMPGVGDPAMTGQTEPGSPATGHTDTLPNYPDNYMSNTDFDRRIAEAQDQRPGKFDDPKVHEVTYRVDSRPPQDVANDGGIFPNPNKPEGSLVDHTGLGMPGNGSYVSTSSQSANDTTVTGTDFPKIDHPDNMSDAEALAIINNYPVSTRPRDEDLPPPFVHTVFEYKMEKVYGTELNASHYGDEKEITSNGIPNNEDHNIQVREITLTVPWEIIDRSDEDGGSYYINPGSLSDGTVTTSPWTPLPNARPTAPTIPGVTGTP
jgi:hypothetical protein